MQKFFRELYGTGIIFFYYIKWLVFIGLPLLYYGLEYKHNTVMDILWLYCATLILKDFVFSVILKKKHGEDDIKS